MSTTTTHPMPMDPTTTALHDAEPLIVGLQANPVQANADVLWQHASHDGYDFVITRLPRPGDVPRADVLQLEPSRWRTSVVGRLPESCHVTDDSTTENYSNDVLEEQWKYALQWAVHMNLPAVLVPPLPTTSSSPTLAAYIRHIQMAVQLLSTSTGAKIWIPIRLEQLDQALQAWQSLLQATNFPPNVGMVLHLEQPSAVSPKAAMAAVLTQLHVAMGMGPIVAVQFQADSTGFLTNRKGYPTLSKAQQTLVTFLLRRVGRRLRFLVEQATAPTLNLPPLARGATLCLPHLQYLQHLRQRPAIRACLDTVEARLEADYLDGLQHPLQPLKDHLENQTYETFEKDPVKYRQYRGAIALALQDKATQPTVVLAVVGAGRGPLVDAAIQAYASLNTTERPNHLRLWAVEKNPSAVQRLRSRSAYDPTWKDVVHILAADLRHVTAQALGGQPIDIVVSELLGSWGCNEVSPECLEGLWSTNAVHPHTVSIPTSYTSYLAPVASVKLWQQARQRALYPNPSETGVVGLTVAMDTGYVVRPYEASQMAAAQPCWTFTHPLSNSTSLPPHDNLQRHVHLEFPADSQAVVQGCGYGAIDDGVATALSSTPHDAATVASPDGGSPPSPPWTLTGLLGTFTTILYQRAHSNTDVVYLSTCPTNFSVGMFSWFPLYLPLATPLMVPSGATVRVQAWRRTRSDAVWYEWSASVWKKSSSSSEAPTEECLSASPIHNSNGQSSHVSL